MAGQAALVGSFFGHYAAGEAMLSFTGSLKYSWRWSRAICARASTGCTAW